VARSFKIYQGEDETPVYDLTDPTSNVHVIWEEIEAGGRAFRGESTTNSIRIRDEQAETGNSADLPVGLTNLSLSRGSRWEWLDGPDGSEVRMAAGRIGTKDYTRGRQKADRAREVDVQAGDRNEELQDIIVDDWARPEETDVARVLALLADYLDGSPRPTTVIADTWVAAGNTITLPARTYDGTSPHGVLTEIASVANKGFFVTVDDALWYDTEDSTAYVAGLRISDRIDEVDTVGEVVAGEPHTTIPTPNGDFEDGGTLGAPADNWDSGFGDAPLANNPAGGGFTGFGDYVGYANTLDPLFRYVGWVGQTFQAGVSYSIRVYGYGAGNPIVLYFGSMNAAYEPTGDFVTTGQVGSGSYTLTWIPTANATDVTFIIKVAGHGHLGVDQLLLLNTGSAFTFPPIWDVGPASSEDGLELVSGLRLYYGQGGDYVYVSDSLTAAEYWHAERSFYTSDPSISDATKATVLADAILDRLKTEDRTYNVSIGPLNREQIGLIKPGQLINIKARAIPDADDQFRPRRIAQLKWTTPVPGAYYARMQLGRPIKAVPYGVGPKSSNEAIQTHKEGTGHTASAIAVIDVGGYFTGTDVEAVLQEIGAGGGGGGVTDHGALIGLTDDDHPQYADADDAEFFAFFI
jgi:hypothetical protein